MLSGQRAMIQVTPQMRVLVSIACVDFRKGIDGLAQVCREVLQAEPMSGVVFAFRNRAATAIKVLVYDGRGFWLCQMRLSSGRFRWWPQGTSGGRSQALESHELSVLLAGGDPSRARGAPMWRRVSG